MLGTGIMWVKVRAEAGLHARSIWCSMQRRRTVPAIQGLLAPDMSKPPTSGAGSRAETCSGSTAVRFVERGETAEVISSALGLAIAPDPRLCERVNWGGGGEFESFKDDWRRSVSDRDFVPPGGDSSRQAGERMRAFLEHLSALEGTVVAVTHGGVTTDLLRTLLGDDELSPELLRDGVPPCAITTIKDMQVTGIASVAHLRSP